MTNTRIKDLFDLWVLLHDTTMDDAELQRAIEATFTRRETAVPGPQPIRWSDAFTEDATNQVQWRAFLKKNRLDAMDLAMVVSPSANALQALNSPTRGHHCKRHVRSAKSAVACSGARLVDVHRSNRKIVCRIDVVRVSRV